MAPSGRKMRPRLLTTTIGHHRPPAHIGKLSNYVETLAANGSIFTILAISFERYYAICKPLKASYKCTRLRATIIICLIWLVSSLLTSPILMMARSSETIYIDGSIVQNCILETGETWQRLYVVVSMLAFFCLPLLALMLVYWLIGRRLIRDNLIVTTTTTLAPTTNKAANLANYSPLAIGQHPGKDEPVRCNPNPSRLLRKTGSLRSMSTLLNSWHHHQHPDQSHLAATANTKRARMFSTKAMSLEHGHSHHLNQTSRRISPQAPSELSAKQPTNQEGEGILTAIARFFSLLVPHRQKPIDGPTEFTAKRHSPSRGKSIASDSAAHQQSRPNSGFARRFVLAKNYSIASTNYSTSAGTQSTGLTNPDGCSQYSGSRQGTPTPPVVGAAQGFRKCTRAVGVARHNLKTDDSGTVTGDSSSDGASRPNSAASTASSCSTSSRHSIERELHFNRDNNLNQQQEQLHQQRPAAEVQTYETSSSDSTGQTVDEAELRDTVSAIRSVGSKRRKSLHLDAELDEDLTHEVAELEHRQLIVGASQLGALPLDGPSGKSPSRGAGAGHAYRQGRASGQAELLVSQTDPSKRQQMESRRQVVLMLAFVVACFFLLFFPYRVFTLWLIFSTTEQIRSLGMETYYNLTYFSRILIYLHSAINPIAYNLISTKFRRAFTSILLCRGSSSRRRFASGGLGQQQHQHQQYHHHHQMQDQGQHRQYRER